MKDTASFRRTVVAFCLVAAALTSAVWSLLLPPFPSGYAARLIAIDEAGTSASVSAVFFAVSQLFMLGAVLGLAHLIRHGAPALSNIGGGLAVVGTVAHAIFGGANLMTLSMAHDSAHREVHARVLEEFESSPMMLFAVAGLLGTVLGLLLLSIGLFRSRVVPRWVPALIWTFLVVEFVGSALSDYATYVSVVALAITFGALARQVWQSPRAEWAVGENARTEVVTAA